MVSIGGATSTIDLSSSANQTSFTTSLNTLLDTYGFDGIDLDIESGNAITVTGGTISSPTNPSQLNLIQAVKDIMAHYRLIHGKKCG